MQTQNLFIEFRPQKNFVLNAGLLRAYDNIRVPYYTPTDHLVYKGFRLALFGSDASGIGLHYSPKSYLHTKLAAYQLYENNVEQDDDVQLYEAGFEYDLDIVNTIGLHGWYVRDNANGEGGVSILGQGLNSSLSNYNGVFNFDLGNQSYNADIFWLGTHFHGNPLFQQGRFGYNGFAFSTLGSVDAGNRDISVMGFGANLRLAYKYGRTPNDFVSFDGVYTTGDDNGITDDEYSGVLTGNNWTAPGAVFFSHGLYLLMPHANVVNRYFGAVVDIQNIGYGLQLGSVNAAYDIIRHKLRVRAGGGFGMASVTPPVYVEVDDNGQQHTWEGGSYIGTEFNASIRYTLRVFMDLELHAAYLALGDFYETPATNGWRANDTYTNLADAGERPDDPWVVMATLKWIMF
jgi:hypothetical protein